MFRYARFVLACCALAVVTFQPAACRPANLPPGGQPVWDQIQFLKVMEALQQTAIDANHAQPQQLKDAQEVVVLKFTRGAAKAVKAADYGWQAVVRTLWEQAQKDLDAATKTRYQTQFQVIAGLVSVIPGGK